MPTPKPSGNIKKLLRFARSENLELWFEDECHFQQHGSRCVMWVPPEIVDPVILHAPTRESVAVFGAVCAADGRLVVRREEKFNAESFHAFLQQLLRYYRRGKKMVMILDNSRYHHARDLKPWLREHRKFLSLDFLPPYSPELNAIERVWKLTRRLCTHNRYFPSLEELIETVLTQFDSWRRPNQTIRRLCAII
jgi:transposase